MDMDFKALAEARRSCRSFATSPVSEDQLTAILDAGRWAPSPLNQQPWEFIVITDPETKTEVRKVTEEAMQLVKDKGGPEWAAKYSPAFLEEAPVLVVVVFNPSKGGLGNYFGQKYGALQAASACVQNMLLAASEMGFGTLWFTWFEPDRLQAVLNVPENLDIAAVVPIGLPKDPMKAPPRKDPKIHRERYQKAE